MKKTRHNKKRNTGFLYEALIKELTKTIINNDVEKKSKVIFIIKEYFGNESILTKELALYKALNGLHEMEPITAEKIIFEAKQEYKFLNKEEIFNEQSRLISKINRILSKNVFSNFVPNYKNLATIAQIFGDDSPLKTRILLEESLFKDKEQKEIKTEMVPIDNLVYKTFVKKFNDKYEQSLFKEQKELLNKYIISVSDGGLEFRMFLNEELERLKKIIVESLDSEDVKKDSPMTESTKKVLNVINGFKKQQIGPKMLKKILKIQDLTREIQTSG